MSKKHFKLTDKDIHHIFNSPSKIAIFVAVFVTIVLCVFVLIQMDLKTSKKSVQILSQAEQTKSDAQAVMIDNYKKEVKNILSKYLLQRKKKEFSASKACQSLVNQTVEQVLNLTVPVDYKEFHLKLVVLLDKENKNCSTGAGELDEEWKELLNEYEWLSFP